MTPVEKPPVLLPGGFTAVAEDLPEDDSRWWDEERCAAFVASLSDIQRERFDTLKDGSSTVARTAYRRTRNGKPVWEMREDDIAGCLRTARGGSSKQAVVVIGNGEARMRWMTGLEYARLQGAGSFNLDGFKESQVQYAFGDAVAAPAVTWLMKQAIIPTLTEEARNGR